ncbi:hypothetical protein LTS18_012049, partial [Coniosporium uncinatum]
MASGRSIGGGRVLGNASTLSPAAAARPQPHKRNSSLLAASPSESSVSLNSQVSSPSITPAAGTPLSLDIHDLSSRIELGPGNGASNATDRLVCPICNDEMVTLLQLNRHIDDLHQNLEEIEQDEVKTWFKTQLVKAKKFQPLAVLNQKLKGLDVFESNDPPILPVPSTTSHSRNQSGQATPEPAQRVAQDPDELVARAHWQRPGYADSCAEPMCGKRLGGVNGNINCRHCGRLFCEEHTMYQMKLSRSAQHEPVRGVWCRVCETCYKSREGYNDHRGLERNHFEEFARTRRKIVDKRYLETGKLETRLTRLTQILANSPANKEGSGGSILWPLSGGAKAQQRSLEQSVIAWEEDASVPR